MNIHQYTATIFRNKTFNFHAQNKGEVTHRIRDRRRVGVSRHIDNEAEKRKGKRKETEIGTEKKGVRH